MTATTFQLTSITTVAPTEETVGDEEVQYHVKGDQISEVVTTLPDSQTNATPQQFPAFSSGQTVHYPSTIKEVEELKKEYTKMLKRAKLIGYMDTHILAYSMVGMLTLSISLFALLSKSYSAAYIFLVVSLGFWGMVITVRKEKNRRVNNLK